MAFQLTDFVDVVKNVGIAIPLKSHLLCSLRSMSHYVVQILVDICVTCVRVVLYNSFSKAERYQQNRFAKD